MFVLFSINTKIKSRVSILFKKTKTTKKRKKGRAKVKAKTQCKIGREKTPKLVTKNSTSTLIQTPQNCQDPTTTLGTKYNKLPQGPGFTNPQEPQELSVHVDISWGFQLAPVITGRFLSPGSTKKKDRILRQNKCCLRSRSLSTKHPALFHEPLQTCATVTRRVCTCSSEQSPLSIPRFRLLLRNVAGLPRLSQTY